MILDAQTPDGEAAMPSLLAGGDNAGVVPVKLTEKLEVLTHAPQCELLGEFGSFGWWLQGVLAVLSFSSLLIKRWQEKPRRPLKVFCFDTLKQITGSGVLHILNLVFASLLSSVSTEDADPCEWYWLNIMVDTTLGVYVLHLLVEWMTRWRSLTGSTAFGYYGNPPAWRACLRQVLVWQVIVSAMKMLMVLVMVVGQTPLTWIAAALLNSLDDQPRVKLVVVMVLTPLTMNTIQYWITDNIIKRKPGTSYGQRQSDWPQGRETYHPVEALRRHDGGSSISEDVCLEDKA
ncbi:klla0c10076p, related [Neospora caninum Liverpool]|uniref:Klla0c10076p, related n=1 Tax=Neospora caninum (strain Liverpool) TaxID=572307 RepID=F0V7D9_NEOCL|nr:klla0c10076p, related [Neospora caninum Liverpool]CBZ49630.1 klla0c10076p, related [Neospora caninum Liverpool]CEL64212.1 TPA: KLLA0C10076p, related [Neospora caninum Liverpool]|eukprot:XP_003879665.1 klla0c10076p, related [Neospora caninum Liverpool]